MKILYSGYRDARHSKFGGYDYIAKHPNSVYMDAQNLPFGFIPVGQRGKRLNLVFLYLKTRRIAHQYDIIHIFYADPMLFCEIKKSRKERHCQFVATIHLSAEQYSNRNIKVLQSYDKVVCLSSAQENYLRSKKVNAYFIPHGFNAVTFDRVETNIDKSKLNVFYSGTNYRDFDLFYGLVKKMAKENIDMVFHTVGQSPERKKMLVECENVVIYPHIDDDKYYSLLSQCDYNFLPLTYATANNALLEAQNLGVVSILPQINGIIDYASAKDNLFYDNVQSVEKLFKNLEKNSFSENLVSFSKKFEWSNIYKALDNLYAL